MRDLLDSKTRRYIFVGFCLIAIYFGFFYIDKIGEFISRAYQVFRPLVYGLVIAFIINLPINFFHNDIFSRFDVFKKNKKLSLTLSLAISWIIFFAMVTIVLTVLIPELSRAITKLSENIPVFFDSLVDFLDNYKFLERASHILEDKVQSLDLDGISRTVTSFLQGFLNSESSILNKTGSIISTVSQGILALGIGFIFSIYVSLNKNGLADGITGFIFAHLPIEVAKNIIYVSKLSYASFSRFLETKILSCIALGVACFIGMLILRLPSAGMISILMGAFDIIPYIGAFSATAIGMILIFIYSPAKALIFLIFILILQQVQQQIFYPLVIGKHQGLPAIWIFVSVVIGGGLFGVFGMVAFIPLATVVYTLVTDNTKKKLKNKKISEEEIEDLRNKTYEEIREENLKDM
ncbi:AI-2E family transporter [uncultured Anaerococcus sp.]|uniref:AI-2E family transporter n=1 Tax=uncultured Anaerococcus sp. TaxID=293428 RepID=UPI00263092E2|nr:AI-2E family transporter [uncultured Anaerococcus sp.]